MDSSVPQLLDSELSRRRAENRRYSLRAFARDLQISPSFLSHLLKGEKSLSADRAVEISRKLGWSSQDTRLFVNLCQQQKAQDPNHQKLLREDLETLQKTKVKFDRLKADQFAVVSDWYHFAILELIDVEGFSSNPTWIAHRLKISVTEAMTALDCLLRLKLVQTTSHGQLIKMKNNSVRDCPSAAIRKFHIQHLQKAKQSIERDAFEKRYASGITVAVDPSQLSQAMEMIRDFRARMSRHFKKGKKKNVYHLAVQLYPLDQGHKDV